MMPSQVEVGTESIQCHRAAVLELRDRFKRQIPDEVDVAVLNGRDLSCAFRNDAQGHGVELRRAADVVLGIAHELDAIAGAERLEPEWPGADRLRCQRVDLVARHDARLPVAEQVGEPRVGDLELEAHRMAVGCLHAVDDLEIDARHRADRRIENALDRREHVLGVEFAAVMPLHALAQLEGPGLEVVAAGPALGQIGLQLAVPGDLGQAAEHQEVDEIFLADLGLGRIERVDVGADRDAQRTGGGARRPDESALAQQCAAQNRLAEGAPVHHVPVLLLDSITAPRTSAMSVLASRLV